MSANGTPHAATDALRDIDDILGRERKRRITPEDAKRRIRKYVADMAREYSELYRRYREVVHENAVLSARLDRYEQRAKDEDWSWLNG